MIPIQTSKGLFKIWTKRIGNNPKIKVLLLNGGPGALMNILNVSKIIFLLKELNLYIMTN